MDYKSYKNTRNAAWKLLLDSGADRLPVDLNAVCRELGVHVHSYQSADRFLKKHGLTDLSQRTDGFTFFSAYDPVILFDQARAPHRVRFTVAHELGHLILGHVVPGTLSVARRTSGEKKDAYETAADQFAARLLAPACVLWGLGIRSPQEIAEVCHISRQAAEIRARRMAVLYRREKFLCSPIERDLYQRFLPFIQEYRSSHGAGR